MISESMVFPAIYNWSTISVFTIYSNTNLPTMDIGIHLMSPTSLFPPQWLDANKGVSTARFFFPANKTRKSKTRSRSSKGHALTFWQINSFLFRKKSITLIVTYGTGRPPPSYRQLGPLQLYHLQKNH